MEKTKEQEHVYPCEADWHHASSLLFKEWEHEYHLTKDHTDYALFRNDFPESEYMLEVAKHLNKVDWCPLFGELPSFGNCLPPDTQISKCCEIIENARHVLGSLPLRTDYKENGWVIKCPEPKEMPFYPEDKLLAARKLFSNWESEVMPYIEAMQRQPYRKISSRTYLSDALHHWPDDALLDCIEYAIGVDNLKAFEVFALLAIYNAWDALGDMLIFWLPENDDEVMRYVQDASFLLARAESEEATGKIVAAEIKVQKIKEANSKRPKILGKKGGKAKRDSEIYKFKNTEWKKRASMYDVKKFGKSRVAGLIKKDIRKQIKDIKEGIKENLKQDIDIGALEIKLKELMSLDLSQDYISRKI